MLVSYTQVCPVVFGPGATGQVGEEVKKLHGKNVLCVYDENVEKAGIADKIAKSLAAAGCSVSSYNGVKPYLSNDSIREAARLAGERGVDTIVGIGGGTAMDTAKLMTVFADNDLPISEYYTETGIPVETKTNLVLMPTASGTGSEVTAICVVYDEPTDSKKTVLRGADLAVVDPELTLSTPPAVTAASGMDALSHAMECYTTCCRNPKSDVLALKAIELIHKNLETAYIDGENLEARTNLSLASNFAGIAFNDASVHIGHAIAHEMETCFHISHGAGCALTLPEVVCFSANVLPERAMDLAFALGISPALCTDGIRAGELAAEEIRELMRSVGIPSLASTGISRADFIAIAENAVNKYPFFISCAPTEVPVSDMREVLAAIYDNYQ